LTSPAIALTINDIVEDRIDLTLLALADPTRRRVVEVLQAEACPAGTIAARLGMSPAATSRHLRTLRTAGLVEVETPGDDARLRVYRLRLDHLVALQAWLDQVRAHWTEQLGAFKDHAERTRGGRAHQ
jgi:DNA-binding transcriptional ArsR family regulator